MGERKITVIIPCYNLENEISKCLDSIINNSYQNLEIIVVDDGSKDSSVDVVKEYSKKDTRVEYICQENQGPSMARNVGIENATGDYIMFVDGDDYIGKNYIENLEKGIKEDCDLVIAGLRYVYGNGEQQIVDGIKFNVGKTKFINTYYAYCIKNRLIFGPYNKLYKTKLLKDNHIYFDKTISIREDGLFVLDVIKKATSFSGIKDAEYFYVQHSLNGSLISKFHKNETEINQRFFQELLSIYGEKIPNKEEILSIYPMYLNMDISSIRKYFNSEKPTYQEAMKYIKRVLNSNKFKSARKTLVEVQPKYILKYYRPAFVVYLINWVAIRRK